MKLVTISEFKKFSPNCTFSEFEDNFLSKQKDPTQKSRQIFVCHPIDWPTIEEWRLKPIMSHIAEHDFVFKEEKYSEYVERCLKTYKTDYIYTVYMMISSTLDIKMEYRELPSFYMMQDNPELKPNRIWIENETIPDNKFVPLLKDLVIEFCSCLEKKGITNYTISPYMEALNIISEDKHAGDLSWGNYEPY